MKKRIFLILICLLAVLLSACSFKPKYAEFIGDRQVQYNETKKGWEVFWAFYYDKKSEPMTQDADINIEIINDNGDSIFKKTFSVTESDYSYWKYGLTQEEKLLGSIFIPVSEVKKGSEDTGKLLLSADLSNGYYFDADELYIYNLPLMDLSIATPSLPLTINNYGFRGQLNSTVEINSITFNYNYSAEAEIVLTMTYNCNGDSKDDYVHVPYKIKDKNGVIIDSGSFLCGQLSVGDTIKDDTYLSDVKLGEDYIIELFDYSY